MAYRRSAQASRDAREYRRFVRENARRFEQSGVPLVIYESRERFDYFVMHGYHPDDATHFSDKALDDGQRRALVEILVRYVKAGWFEAHSVHVLGPEVRRRVAGAE